jgi:hypothetical protein
MAWGRVLAKVLLHASEDAEFAQELSNFFAKCGGYPSASKSVTAQQFPLNGETNRHPSARDGDRGIATVVQLSVRQVDK